MSNRNLDAKIAEFMGWERWAPKGSDVAYLYSPERINEFKKAMMEGRTGYVYANDLPLSTDEQWMTFPHYSSDLNEMAKVEAEVIRRGKTWQYEEAIFIEIGYKDDEGNDTGKVSSAIFTDFLMVTAEQKARAVAKIANLGKYQRVWNNSQSTS